MFEYIFGKITELNPAYVVIEANNVGYIAHISLHTFSVLDKKETYKLYTHQVVREDVNMLFGFSDKSEREIFKLLISVSGIGPNTARVMLSSLKAGEIKTAILSEDVNTIKSIKGIGVKTAQRVIIDLKDKINKTNVEELDSTSLITNTASSEALAALTMLGFPKSKAEKAIKAIISKEFDITVEDLVKKALKIL
ncbi:MAG: Holliday junction branch migration protein RuvA [Chlorobi bacterium]|nr:Holliday junction branch migration protein RuvA [Chlorobiota bacterium]